MLPFVGPNYKDKYAHAAKNTLSGCVRQVLTLAQEEGLKTVAFPCAYCEQKHFPLEPMAHVVLRTLRRILVATPKVQTVVLYAQNSDEMAVYETLLGLYFPRSPLDSQFGVEKVAQEEGFSWGNDVGEEVEQEGRTLVKSKLIQNLKDPADYRI